MNRLAIYPGTFDPITNGHLDVLERACRIFDQVIVTVAINSSKKPLFSLDERQQLIRDSITNLSNASVQTFEGLLVNFSSSVEAVAIVRGLRQITDFEYEFQMALMNRKLKPEIITVFLMPHEKYTFLNSSIIREVARLGGNVSDLIPEPVNYKLQEKFRKE